jgi:hypothetical protein
MQYVFLDTSVFIKENFLEGDRINQILDMGRDGKIQLLVSLITVNEVKLRYKICCKEACYTYNVLIKNHNIWALRNFSSLSNQFRRLPKVSELTSQFEAVFDRKLSESKAIILSYPIMNTGETFEKYFTEQPPFSNRESKKHEFPDHFALSSLSQWCEINKQRCMIFSMDKGFKNLNEYYLDFIPNYEKKCSELSIQFLQQQRINLLTTLVDQNSANIKSEVASWVEDDLYDENVYFDIANSYQVHDIIINSVKIEMRDFEVVHTDKELIVTEINTVALIDVAIEIDDEESMYKDYDDKTWHFAYTKTVKIRRVIDIPIKVVFNIVDVEVYLEEAKVTEINNGKELELEDEFSDD